jgi:MFS family permease
LFNLFLMAHGYSEKRLGLLTSAMAAGNLAGAIPAGKVIQRWGLRPALLSCILLAASAFSARAMLLEFAAQLGLAFLCGATLSLWAICISPAVAQLTDEKHRPFAFSLFFSLGIGVGSIAGLLGGRLPGLFSAVPWATGAVDPERMVLLLSCVIVAISLWPAATLTFSHADRSAQNRPFLSPFLLRFLPAIAIWSLVTGSFSPFANVYFAHHLHMTLPEIGTAFSLSQLAQVVAVLFSPFIFRRWGMISGIVFTQCSTALCLLSLALVRSPLQATVVYIGFTAFQWMNEPGTYSLLMNNVPPADRGGAAASNSLVISSVQMVAAACAGGVFTKFGYSSSLGGIALIAGIAAALFWVLLAPTREPSNS